MNTLYLGKLEYADPLYEILSSKVCPAVRDPIFHVNSMSNRSVYKYTEEKTRVAAYRNTRFPVIIHKKIIFTNSF
jgi:hypothetical protein